MTSNRRYVLLIVMIVTAGLALGSFAAWRSWNDYRRGSLPNLCRLARTGQRWEELQGLAEEWTRLDPQNGEAWMNRGLAANARKEWEQAAEHFWRVPDSSPQAIPAMIEVSKLAFTHLNKPLKGVEACERILKIDPAAAGARQQLIWFYSMTLQRAKLRQQILEAIERRCEPREAYVYYFLLYTIRSQDAVGLNQRWLQGSPNSELFQVASVINLPDPTGSPESPNATSNASDDLLASGEKTKLQQVDELLTRFPHNLELIAYKAEERFKNGDPAKATAILKSAPDSAANDGRFWRFKGWIHEINNQLEASTKAYQKALELHPVDWNTMNRLSIVERRLQDQSEVKRLTSLVERGNDIRKRLRQQVVETASPQILQEMAVLFRDCHDGKIADSLESRLAAARAR